MRKMVPRKHNSPHIATHTPVSPSVCASRYAAGSRTIHIESRFIKFTPTGWNMKGIILCVIGLIPLAWALANLDGVIMGAIGAHVGRLVSQTIMLFYIMIVWPLVIKLFTGSKA